MYSLYMLIILNNNINVILFLPVSDLPAFIETLHTAAAGLNQYQDRTLQVTHQGDSMCISARRKENASE